MNLLNSKILLNNMTIIYLFVKFVFLNVFILENYPHLKNFLRKIHDFYESY